MPPKPKRVTTRSAASKKQRQDISIASGSSPPKGTRPKKSPKKQASFELPEVTKITPQVVTLPKKKQKSLSEESSNDSSSTGDENASVKMASNLPTNVVFDSKFEHLLTYYFMANCDQHDIRQAFIQSDIKDFELFVSSCEMEFLRDIQLKKGNSTGDALNKAKLKLVNNVLLYYEFLYQDKEYAKADDPI